MFHTRSSLTGHVSVAILLTVCATSAAAEPPPWHVPDAEIRFPVTVHVTDALLRMPPQVYLADLKPVETTDGLSFDPQHKCALVQDIRKPEEIEKIIAAGKEELKKAKRPWDPNWYLHKSERDGGPLWRIRGSATYAIKPEYKWFSWGPEHAKISFDGKLVGENVPIRFSNPNYLRYRRVLAIPPDAQTMKIEGEARFIIQPGFVTRSPAVAQAALCVADRDPTTLIPIVHRLSGEQVGCRIVWAEPGKQMTILFDSSSGDRKYLVYLVDRAKNPKRLEFTPKAGLVQEARYLERYDPEVESLEGFQKLWNSAPTHAGKLAKPVGTIYRGHLPFNSKRGDVLGYNRLMDATPPALSRDTGYFHVPSKRGYRFYVRLTTGGYLFFDGQLAAKFRGRAETSAFDIELEPGMHRLDLWQYTYRGHGIGAGLWWLEPVNQPHGGKPGKQHFGNIATDHHRRMPAYLVWESMADATAAPLEKSDQVPVASFTWSHRGNLPAMYPAQDMRWYWFNAHLPGVTDKPPPPKPMPGVPEETEDPANKVIYRWQFGDGRPVEGKRVIQTFVTPGTRPVELEILRGPDEELIGRATGKIHVQPNLAAAWSAGLNPPLSELLWELIEWHLADENPASKLTIEELVSLYFWSYPLDRHHAYARAGRWTISTTKNSRWPKRVRMLCARGLALRANELIEANYPYIRLLQIAQSLVQSQNGPAAPHFAAAEKLLKAVMDRAPPGSDHWRIAATALVDIYVSVRDDPDRAMVLTELLESTEPTIDMDGDWEFAHARKLHYLAETDKSTELTQGLDWSTMARPFDAHLRQPPFVQFKTGRGIWFAKEFHLPAAWKGKELVINAGPIHGSDAFVWFNGEPLGRRWQWPDGNMIVPGNIFHRGKKNRLTFLFQPRPQAHQVWVSPPAISSDFKRGAWMTASIPNHGTIQLMSKGKQLMLDGAPMSEVRSLAFSPDGRWVAAGYHRSRNRLWDAETGKAVWKMPARSLAVVSLVFSPDGNILASGSEDSRINLFDAATGKFLRALNGHTSEVLCLAFSPDGKRLASASFDKTVKIWETDTARQLFSIDEFTGPVNAVAFSRDGKTLATGFGETQIAFWDANNGTRLRILEGQPGEVTAIAFSPDGRRLATGSRERVAAIWDLESGSRLVTLDQHGHAVVRVMFSPDSKRLLTVGGAAARFWDCDTGKEAGGFHGVRGHGEHIHRVNLHGLHMRSPGYESFPVDLYTDKTCDEVGMRFTCYDGKWDKLPDFDSLEPVRTGVVKNFDSKHLQNILLRYRVITNEGVIRWEIRPSGLKLTGFLKVKNAGDYEFGLQSRDGSRLYVDSKLAVDNDGPKNHEQAKEPVRGSVRLEPGVHPITVTYFHRDPHPHRSLGIIFPRQFVRDLTIPELDEKHVFASAYLHAEDSEKGERFLLDLQRERWPLDDLAYSRLSNTLKGIHQRAGKGDDNVVATLETIRHWEQQHPLLLKSPQFLIGKIEALVGAGDYIRAQVLVDRLNKVDLTDGQRRYFLLKQVQWNVRAEKMGPARDVYQQLKTFAPTSTEAAEAREAIKQAVLNQFEGK